MDISQWLKAFRGLHDRYKHGALNPGELATYKAGRDELARALLAAQHVMVKAGETPRRQIRALRALQVDVDHGGEKVRALTQDLSPGGFGVLLARSPAPGEALKASLRLPGQEPVAGVVRVVDAKVQQGNARVSFAWQDLPVPEEERLETFVFDCILDKLAEK